MAFRNTEFNQFCTCLESVAGAVVRDRRSQVSLRTLFGRLQRGPSDVGGEGDRLPVCTYLETALLMARSSEILHPLVDAFAVLEPHLVWKPRSTSGPHASANFATSHANAMIAGPGGLQERDDLWLGVSLLAPHVRYPDHTHPPEETYLVLSEGDFMQGPDNWFTPGIGGSFYNSPGILHAMRSGDAPLFAIWALLPEHIAR